MPKPTFSKTGVTTVTLSSGATFPYNDPRVPNQFVGISDANTIRTATLGPRRKLLVVPLEQLDAADKAAIIGFLENPLVNYAQASFTYTDEKGIAETVRYLQPEFSLPEIAEDNVAGTLTFTVI